MISSLFYKIKKIILVFYWRFFLSINYKINFEDLNFRRIDFANYKQIRQYIFKDNFFSDKKFINAHSFDFLLYLNQIGGKTGISLSKKNIFLWYANFKNKINFPWDNNLASKRFINLIYGYDFINSASNLEEKKLINSLIYLHTKRIILDFKASLNSNISSNELLAVILINLISKKKESKFFNNVEDLLIKQVDNIGMHKSYNPVTLAKFINNMNEIKDILLYFGNSIPNKLNYTILNSTSILKQYIHDDGSIALFNGANNNYSDQIIKTLNSEEFLKSRTFQYAENGIAFYNDKNKKIFFDVVQPNSLEISKNLSAGTLSFEFSALGEKIITNCGASESGGENPEYLRYSAAHSTIILKNTNISEIKEKNPHIKYPQNVSFEYEDLEDRISFEGSHNGYMKRYKKIVRRKLTIVKNLNKIIGEDSIISFISKSEKTVYHIRFHIMPDIITNLTNNKKNIILKTKQNKIWLFKTESEINLEDSIYVDNNSTKQIQQIVIKGITADNKQIEKWSIEKI